MMPTYDGSCYSCQHGLDHEHEDDRGREELRRITEHAEYRLIDLTLADVALEHAIERTGEASRRLRSASPHAGQVLIGSTAPLHEARARVAAEIRKVTDALHALGDPVADVSRGSLAAVLEGRFGS